MHYRELALVVCVLAAVATIQERPRDLYGYWAGKTHGQPSVELNVSEAQGRPQGTITFILLHQENGKWVAKGTTKREMLRAAWHGRALEFEVEHATEHKSAKRGPNVRFRLEATGADSARLEHLGSGDVTALERAREQ